MSGEGWFHKLQHFAHNIELSFVITVTGICLLFSSAIATILIAPRYVDRSWIEPTSPFQVQMYEEDDPNFYIGRSSLGVDSLEYLHHLQEGHTLLAFQESNEIEIKAPKELEKYVTKLGEKPLKLTSHLLLLRPIAQEKGKPAGKQVMELYEVGKSSAFAVASSDEILANYVDSDFQILDERVMRKFHQDPGVIFVRNPQEYRFALYEVNGEPRYRYDPNGKPLESLEMAMNAPFGFVSRQALIRHGEEIYKKEGCWYCHTDQTRTLIQDTVLNGTETYAAPPSSANEYIYQHTSFLGTRRIGPDISRVGVKRPSRDWHKAHFWSPKTASLGSIMPAFRHLFTYDPRGTSNAVEGVPNLDFEGLYQYLMTKGTRMLPPTQSWWLGKDPLHTTLIIEGAAAAHEH